YFSGCISALNSTYIPFKAVKVPNLGAYRNRKGGVSQNVLAYYNFEGMVTYILPR
ncbi:uncharacterized protein MYCFIDRAFT_44956, partial [Pseudocercospora fijiensis CIRAD86]